MQAPRFSGIVRVTNSRDEIDLATQVGIEKKREGYSPEALVLAVDEVVHNLPLARAIVVYVQSTVNPENDAASEMPFSWFSVLASVGFALSCFWLVLVLFRQVGPSMSVWVTAPIVLGQALLLRLGQRGLRLAFMSVCDGLNDASYPTKLHPLRTAATSVSTLRLRRLRALVIETADRIIAGAKGVGLIEELSEVNLTPRAARFVVRLATVNAALRDYLPPYQSRWLGYTLAFAFAVTALICIGRVGDRLAEGYQNYAICVAFWIAGDLGANPRRRLPPPTNVP